MAERWERPGLGRSVAVGCLLALPGLFGGGMVAVAIAKFVGELRRCTPPEGLPACGTFEFLMVGAGIGLLGLPGLALWRLHRRPR